MLQIDFEPFAATIAIDDPKNLDIEVSKQILTTLVETFVKSLSQNTETLIIGHIKAIIDTDSGYYKASLTEVGGQVHLVGDTYEQKNNSTSQITLNSVISGATKEIENQALDTAIAHICDVYNIKVHVHHEKHHHHDHDHGHKH